MVCAAPQRLRSVSEPTESLANQSTFSCPMNKNCGGSPLVAYDHQTDPEVRFCSKCETIVGERWSCTFNTHPNTFGKVGCLVLQQSLSVHAAIANCIRVECDWVRGILRYLCDDDVMCVQLMGEGKCVG